MFHHLAIIRKALPDILRYMFFSDSMALRKTLFLVKFCVCIHIKLKTNFSLSNPYPQKDILVRSHMYRT